MFRYLGIIILAFLLALPTSAQAKPKLTSLFWWPSHWRNQDFQPYYEDSTHPHNGQWDNGELSNSWWTPKEWVSLDGGSGLNSVQKWYSADILRDQYVSNGKPVLVVGPNFYHLGGADKRRVVETVDAVYQVTKFTPKMFYLEDYRTEEKIGYYVPSGLILQ